MITVEATGELGGWWRGRGRSFWGRSRSAVVRAHRKKVALEKRMRRSRGRSLLPRSHEEEKMLKRKMGISRGEERGRKVFGIKRRAIGKDVRAESRGKITDKINQHKNAIKKLKDQLRKLRTEFKTARPLAMKIRQARIKIRNHKRAIQRLNRLARRAYL